jgi:peptidoglycan/xylan/chitin deacetylase (PgdA/CDA1 family)
LIPDDKIPPCRICGRSWAFVRIATQGVLSLLSTLVAAIIGIGAPCTAQTAVPDKTVVLTLDDAVKSQIDFVAPLLEKLNFKATFFISQKWMDDKEHFLTWEEVAELNRRGFEIGNHTWTHASFDTPEKAATLEHELTMIDDALAKVGVPKPVSFAWPGDNFGPEALKVLEAHGIQLARRGMQPEIPYGEIQVGPLLDVKKNHPLLIPTAGDSYPGWTLEHFKKVVAGAKDGKIAVLQFHGVPDTVHPWVNTPPELFRQCMDYLKDNGYHVIALRDVAKYYDWPHLPDDPMLSQRVNTARKK